jgi:hypothetical protein
VFPRARSPEDQHVLPPELRLAADGHADSLSNENLGGANLTLTAEDVAELDAASAQIQVVGDRYPEAMQLMIDR